MNTVCSQIHVMRERKTVTVWKHIQRQIHLLLERVCILYAYANYKVRQEETDKRYKDKRYKRDCFNFS